MSFLNQLNNEIFSDFKLNKDNDILSYNIKGDFFNTKGNTFFFNVCLFKGLKINSQRVAMYLMSMGPHAKYLHLSFIEKLLGIEDKDHKLKQKAAKTVFDTLLKHHFIKEYNYDRKKKIFNLKMEDLKLKELIQDLPDTLDFN